MLVSADELIAYMSNINLSAPQLADANATLSGVQSELEEYLLRPLELVQIREMVRADAMGYANVSVSPVWSILQVTPIAPGYLNEQTTVYTPVYPAPMERDASLDAAALLIDRLGPLQSGGPLPVPGGIDLGVYGAGYGVVGQGLWTVEYIGGLQLNGYELDGVKQDIKRVAAREVARNHDDTFSLRNDNAERATESDNRPKGWTDEELAKWDRLRRRVVV